MSSTKATEGIAETLERELEEMFQQHHDMVYRTAYGVLGNPGDAEDIVQTIFLRMLDRAISPDLKRNPAGYLYRAAVNESLSLIRSRKRFSLVSGSEHLLMEPAPEPSESAEELHVRLYEAVARLNPGAAHILILHYVHKYSDAQIAKMLGRSRSAIAVSLYRTRARLRKWLSACS